MVLVEEDWRAAHLQADLLDALLVVDGDQEGLAAFPGFHSRQDGEVLRKRGCWNRGQRLAGSWEAPNPPSHALQTNQLRDPEAFAVGGGAQAFASHLPLDQAVPATLP